MDSGQKAKNKAMARQREAIGQMHPPKQQVPQAASQQEGCMQWSREAVMKLGELIKAFPPSHTVNIIPPGYGHNLAQGAAVADQAGLRSEDVKPECRLPPALLAMKSMLPALAWEDVLKERAQLLVQEEAQERERAKTAASGLTEAVVEGRDMAGRVMGVMRGQQTTLQEPSIEELLRKLPNQEKLVWCGVDLSSEGLAVKAQAEKQAVQQQVERRLAGLGEPVEALAKPASEMDLALQGLRMVSENLDTLVSALEGRLEHVLEEPQTGKEHVGSSPSSPACSAGLTHRLRSHEAFLRHAVQDRLQSMLDRLVL